MCWALQTIKACLCACFDFHWLVMILLLFHSLVLYIEKQRTSCCPFSSFTKTKMKQTQTWILKINLLILICKSKLKFENMMIIRFSPHFKKQLKPIFFFQTKTQKSTHLSHLPQDPNPDWTWGGNLDQRPWNRTCIRTCTRDQRPWIKILSSPCRDSLYARCPIYEKCLKKKTSSTILKQPFKHFIGEVES